MTNIPPHRQFSGNNKGIIEAFGSLSDHLTNKRGKYYRIPEAKLKELAGVYNKDKMILISWDDKHEKIDVNTLNSDIDEKVIERILKLSKIYKKDENV